MNTPLSNKPKITQEDILNGTVKRYFARHVSTGVVTEIDNAQYIKFAKNPMYETLVIDWNISGFANDTQSTDGKTLYGTKYRNAKLVEYYEKKMRGISRILRNPLEYFFGVFNTSTVIANVANVTPTYEVTPPADPPVIPPPPDPVWTPVAQDLFTDTNGISITSHTPTLTWTGWTMPGSGPGFQIQSNRMRQTLGPFGGRGWAAPVGNITNDAFRAYADIYILVAGGSPGIGFRWNPQNGSTNPTQTGFEGFTVRLAPTGTSGAGRTATVSINRNSVGSTVATNVAVPNYDSIGRRLWVEVNGDMCKIQIQPTGGGTAEFEWNINMQSTFSATTYNDTSHQWFGVISAIGSTPRAEFDNFTVEKLL